MKHFKHLSLFLIAILFLFSIVSGCADDSLPEGYYDPISCDTELTPEFTLTGAKVTYRVTATGEYQLDSILWTDEEGEHTETTITLPFEMEVQFTGEADYKLSIEGSVTNGTINLEAKAETDNGSLSTDTANCSKILN